MSGVWKHFYLTLVLFIDSWRLVDFNDYFLIVFSCYRDCRNGQGQSLLLYVMRPTNSLRGFSISLPLGTFIPADLLTAFVSSLSKSSAPSLLCICFTVFHLRSDMKESLSPRVRDASADMQSHFGLVWPEEAFLSWASSGQIFEAHLSSFCILFIFI